MVQFDARKGDILIWHGKLMHRGSIPKDPTILRPALISHYSNIRDRRDFGNEMLRHGDGGYYWEFSSLGRVLAEDQFERTRIDGKFTAAITARGEVHSKLPAWLRFGGRTTARGRG